MSNDNYTKQEVQSGFLIFLATITLFGLLFMTGSMHFFKQTYEIHVVFDYISGLAKNSPVHFAGHEVGQITNIELLNQEDGKVRVTLNVQKNVVLRKDSQAYIDVMGFMGEKFIELTPGSNAGQPLLEHETIRGTDPVRLTELIKRGTELLDEFEEISHSMKSMTGDLSGIIGNNDDEIDAMIKNFNSVSLNLNEMTTDLKYHPWKLFRKGKEKKIPPVTHTTASNPSQSQENQNETQTSDRKRRFLIF